MIHKLPSSRSNGSFAVTPRNLLSSSSLCSPPPHSPAIFCRRCAQPLKRPLRRSLLASFPSLLRADVLVFVLSACAARVRVFAFASDIVQEQSTNWAAAAACASRGAARRRLQMSRITQRPSLCPLPSRVLRSLSLTLTLSASALCCSAGRVIESANNRQSEWLGLGVRISSSLSISLFPRAASAAREKNGRLIESLAFRPTASEVACHSSPLSLPLINLYTVLVLRSSGFAARSAFLSRLSRRTLVSLCSSSADSDS